MTQSLEVKMGHLFSVFPELRYLPIHYQIVHHAQ